LTMHVDPMIGFLGMTRAVKYLEVAI
jgi:hypothetical protein